MKPNHRARLVSLASVDAEGGEIIKAISTNSKEFQGFGEAYFSKLNQGIFRGWRRHDRSDSIVFIISGSASFHFVPDSSKCFTISLGICIEEKVCLQIPRGLLFGFIASSSRPVTIMNFSSVRHDQDEVARLPAEDHVCEWTMNHLNIKTPSGLERKKNSDANERKK